MKFQEESGNDYSQRSINKIPLAWRHRDPVPQMLVLIAPVLDLIFKPLLGVGVHPSELHKHLQELETPAKASTAKLVEPIKLEASPLNLLEQA